jgi:hypothetical protein
MRSTVSLPSPAPLAGTPVATPIEALLAAARRLQHDPTAGAGLAGCNLALLCGERGASEAAGAVEVDAAGEAEVRAFGDAAALLGARVARLEARVAGLEPARDLRRLGATLGHLYDAIVCLGLPAEVIGPLREAAGGIPVLDGPAAAVQAERVLSGVLDAALPAASRRRLVLQAMLMQALR